MRKHLLALLVLALLLPLAAQASSSPSISNLTYEGVNSNTGKMELSWDNVNVDDMTDAKVQIKGGGITDVWINVWNLSITQDPYSTTASFQDLTSMHDTAYWLNFRVRVLWGRSPGPTGQTPWASVRI
ncbi:MAG: hypothetical protein OXT05_15085 [Chloroflexota bacterium]|nr:hypothetical protein [Chloroflexota bacterium]